PGLAPEHGPGRLAHGARRGRLFARAPGADYRGPLPALAGRTARAAGIARGRGGQPPRSGAAMSARANVPVLMYHHVSPSPGMVTTSPARFEQHIAWLRREGWSALTADEFAGHLAGRPVPPKSVLITFDDGYLDNWLYAHPILQRHG